MPNKRRYFSDGMPLHVVQRGHNKMTVFHDSTDFELFLVFLQRSAARSGVAVHAFALMATHVHMVVTPEAPSSVPRMMQRAGVLYARHFNTRYGRIGTVRQGRYRCHPIDEDRYFYTCLRYVECNPVEARIVAHPHEYTWSSYAAHALGSWPDWLVPHPLYLALGRDDAERQAQYRAICGERVTDDEAAWLRCVIEHQWPYGCAAFVRRLTTLVPRT